jgi:uncharacterized protein (DUF1499 family)
MYKKLASLLAVSTLALTLSGCESPPARSSFVDGKLAACPSSPNCVNSDDPDKDHQIAALQLKGDPAQTWAALKKTIEGMPGTQVVNATDDYMHVVFTTSLMRFKDDVEFVLRPDRQQIAMRSSSNVGYSDFGTNRKRLESVRAALQGQSLAQ